MRKRMSTVVQGILQICLYFVVHVSSVLGGFPSCDPTILHKQCAGKLMQCVQVYKNRGECRCIEGYVIDGDSNNLNCVNATSAASMGGSGAGHGATVAVVVIFTLALVIAAMVLVIRRYNLLNWLQHKINARRNNEVQYEDVMIGQDDPPLTA